MFSSNVKYDINESDNLSKHVVEKNIRLSTESLKNENIKKEETCETNENVNLESNISYERIQIKKEDIKLESEFDTFSNEPSSIIEQSPAQMVEFVEMQIVKTEKLDEYDEEEDPIKISEGTFICEYCKRAFTTSEHCNKHMRRCTDRTYNQPSTSATILPCNKPKLTNDEKLYQCDKCDNKFKSRVGLHLHLRRHSGLGLHTCTECNKQFPLPSLLAAHLLIHTGEKPHKCTLCEAAFNLASNLKKHMLAHTGVRPHTCSQCGKSFTQTSDLTRHMRIHMGERPYQCTQCDKSFPQANHLKKHMRIHSDKKSYECTVCSQAFVQIYHLKRHVKIHSNKT